MGDVFCAWPHSAHRHPELSRKTSATGAVRASWGGPCQGEDGNVCQELLGNGAGTSDEVNTS